jgi:hypothetical protein
MSESNMPVSKKKQRALRPALPAETRASEALTIVWTVTTTMLFFCNLALVVVQLVLPQDPTQQGLLTFRGLLLFSGASLGVLGLALLPVVFQVRRTPPPRGLAVFAACLAAVPLVVVMFRGLK